jgi:hypothetical protein
LKTILVVALAFLWVPITSHCQLETIPSLTALLGCCDHEDTEAPHQDNDCEEDSCASVESGSYRTQEHALLVIVPDVSANTLQIAVTELSDLPDEVSLGVLTTEPPEQRHVWQFAFRTARPVRAPSLVS